MPAPPTALISLFEPLRGPVVAADSGDLVPLEDAFRAAWARRNLPRDRRFDTPEDALTFWANGAAYDQFCAEATGPEQDAAAQWALAWNGRADATVQAAARALGRWGVVAGDRDGTLNPHALHAIAAGHPTAEDDLLHAWDADSAEARASLRTNPWPDGHPIKHEAQDALAAALRTYDASVGSPLMARVLDGLQPPAASGVPQFARRIRGALVQALTCDGSKEDLLACFTDTGPNRNFDDFTIIQTSILHRVSISTWFDDHMIVEMYLASANDRFPIGPPERLALASARPQLQDAILARLRLPPLLAHTATPETLRAALFDVARQTDDGRTRVAAARDALLVEAIRRTSAVPWTWLCALAQRTSLATEIAEMCESETDWFDFDAPGEGGLPEVWAAALVLSGETDNALLEALDAQDMDLAEAVRDTVSPAMAYGARLDPDASPMSSYSQRLHDGVAEAYGDVYSPADPFSTRSAPPAPSEE